MIDLRSDTVTRPTPGMRRAMAEAEVGDDVFGEDPTVRRLEEETAALLGTEAALYVPSGHMSNQLAVYAHTRSGDEVWAHRDAHVVANEQGALAVLSRVQPRVYDAPGPYPDEALLAAWLRGADDVHRARPRLLCLENTFTGRVVPRAEHLGLTRFAREHGIRVHLDGARLWNAAVAQNLAPGAVAEGADTVSVCFSKGLGAPVGSALAGGADTIAAARRARKLLGGGMRQAGIIAAGALYALRHHVDRLAEDHARAERLAAGALEAGLAAEARTNMVVLTAPRGRAPQLADLLAAEGVGAVVLGADRLRLVVHLDITDADIDGAAAAIAKAAAAL
ncbi:aminotransferase class I/II-fold pyridoxal phosphate-dependent enzyme [Streptomonospora sp. S1-112]|uniref:Aminotransferase class I/II-fold pyridoxal phosphate-dependent enzyme n=1 Tax=Streptomonospora mangrovi TaxID=2883123 RepID=A0A9X3NJI0_9ACTN|nr:GntG family PLP-dependent aldolase [Streptomonospora mangrovi]MDA0563206.1 aminotransferase class I/II-fold pyridoxal phosphate-dependent enzyme [Streptomonospora mangrovi]